MPAPVTVDFYYSPASPFAYLAASQMLSLQVQAGCRVDWRPVSGRLLISRAGFDPAQASPHSGQYQPDYRRQDLERWARLYGIPYRHYSDIAIPDPMTLVLACVAAARFDAGQVFARALMKAIFIEGTSPIDRDRCLQIANDTAGITPDLFGPKLDDPETKRIMEADVDRAVAAGCFGVPSFVVARPNGQTEMVFGNDRLPLLRQIIAEIRALG